jgi:anti-anti-sigma factor
MGQRPGALRVTVIQDPPGIAVAGDIDFVTIEEFEQAIRGAIAQFPDDVHVDLGDVEFMDLEGLRTLVHASHTLAEAGRKLVVERMSSHLREVLRIVAWSETMTDIANGEDQ